jgi:ferredoxin
MEAMKVLVDFDKCESYGVCVNAAPFAFDIDDDDVLQQKVEVATDQTIGQLRDAAMRCPKRAIQLVGTS